MFMHGFYRGVHKFIVRRKKTKKSKNVMFCVYLLFKMRLLNVFSPDVSCSCMFQMFVYEL